MITWKTIKTYEVKLTQQDASDILVALEEAINYGKMSEELEERVDSLRNDFEELLDE